MTVLRKIISPVFEKLKGAAKLYFLHYSHMVIHLFNTDIRKTIFPTYSLKNLVFCVSVFRIFCLFNFELDAIVTEL